MTKTIYNKPRFDEQELVSLLFENGKIDALFYRTKNRNEKDEIEPIIIHIHGFLGNFLSGSQRFLPPILAEAGYSSIAINTRMANFGLFFGFGLIDDAVRQIKEVVKYVENMGYQKIMLSGYSIGGCIALRYAALNNDLEKNKSLIGVISLATPYSMSDSVRRRWNKWGSSPSYDDLYEEVKKTIDPNTNKFKEDKTLLIFRARGNTDLPEHTEIYTYQTWWHLAGPEANEAKAYKQIENIKVPIILIQGWFDDVVEPRETYDLAQIALKSGNKDVSAYYVNAGHNFDGKEEELGDVITRWLDRRMLG